MANITPIEYLGDKVYLLDPNTNPATLFFRKAKKRIVGRLDYNTQDDVVIPEFTTVVSIASGTAAAPVINVTTGEGAAFAPWDIMLDKTTGTMLQVVSRSSDALTCVGGVDNVTAVLSSAGNILLKIGNAMEENVGVPLSLTTIETTITNYIQRMSFPIRTGYAAKRASYHYGGSDYEYQKKKKMLEFTLAQDKAFLLNGAPYLATPSTSLTDPADTATREGITMGLRYFISNYADSALNRTEVDLTESEFYEWVKDAFTYGSDSKMLFASPMLAQALMMWNLTRQQFVQASSKAVPGLNFVKVTTPHGELTIVIHKGLRARSTADVSYNFIVDLENVGYVAFKGLDTQVWNDVVKDGSHQTVDEIGAYFGTEFRLANTHAALKMTSFS